MFMVLAIILLGQLGTLAVKSRFKEEDGDWDTKSNGGFAKKDNRMYKAAVAFFTFSLFLSLFFFHLGDHLNNLKRSKNRCNVFYGLTTLFLGVIPLFVEGAAIHALTHLGDNPKDMSTICTIATYGPKGDKTPNYVD